MKCFFIFFFILSIALEVVCVKEEFKRTIDRIHQPTQNEFYKYYLKNEPVIITGGMDKWDLKNEKWTDEGLIKICGNNTLQVHLIFNPSSSA